MNDYSVIRRKTTDEWLDNKSIAALALFTRYGGRIAKSTLARELDCSLTVVEHVISRLRRTHDVKLDKSSIFTGLYFGLWGWTIFVQ